MRSNLTRIGRLEAKRGIRNTVQHVIAFEGVIEHPEELKGLRVASIEHNDSYFVVNMVKG